VRRATRRREERKVKYFVILIAVLLIGCGTDGPSDNTPRPVTVSASLEEGATLAAAATGCEWTIGSYTASPAFFEDGNGRSLPYVRELESGRLYSLTEGAITRWALVGDKSSRAGLSCLREEEFR
jgi:hypothetical protein